MSNEIWTPFVEADTITKDIRMEIALDKMYEKLGTGRDVAPKIYVNSIYQVSVFPPEPPVGKNVWPPMYHLSIKRRDQMAGHDWRHLQRIKNEIIGPEHEALEIYPAESRLVDSANQYHLFVFESKEIRLPIGFGDRFVCNISEKGTVPRPFPVDATPMDCETLDEHVDRKYRENQLREKSVNETRT